MGDMRPLALSLMLGLAVFACSGGTEATTDPPELPTAPAPPGVDLVFLRGAAGGAAVRLTPPANTGPFRHCDVLAGEEVLREVPLSGAPPFVLSLDPPLREGLRLRLRGAPGVPPLEVAVPH